MPEYIYCCICYYNRVRFVGDVCPTCRGKQKPDEDERNKEQLAELEKKPRTVAEVFGFWRGKK